MYAQVYSDIHLEFRLKPKPAGDGNDVFYDISEFMPCKTSTDEGAGNVEVLVLAGDIGILGQANFRPFLQHCTTHWKYVVYVLGNHEYYKKRSMEKVTQQYKELCAEFPNLHLLDNTSVQIGDVLFYGFTGWTPMNCTSITAKKAYNDYRQISTQKGPLTTGFVNRLAYAQAAAFKEFMLSLPADTKVVVVTHFPPLILPGTMTNPEYGDPKLHPGGSAEGGYYGWNDLLQTVELPADKVQAIRAWISGHTHFKCNFVHSNGVRYLSNPAGYPDQALGTSHPAFQL